MSRWRPSEFNCLYAIPAPLGLHHCLKRIFARILPLRKSDGGKDHLVILGDVWGNGKDNEVTVDLLMEVSKRKNVTVLMGRKELDFLEENKNFFISGGYQAIFSYCQSRHLNVTLEDVMSMSWGRLRDMIPKHHLQWLSSLPLQHEIDGFLFSNESVDTDLFNVFSGKKLLQPLLLDDSLQLNAGKWNQLMVCDVESLTTVSASLGSSRLEDVSINNSV